MKKNSLDEYKIAVRARFNEVKNDDISGLLESPSPGNLKKLCIIKAGLINADDAEIFKHFFDITEGNIIRQIEFSDTDKLRPVTNFLRGKTGDTQQMIAELIAVLIDFNPRPYKKYARLLDRDSENLNLEENLPEKKEEREEKNPPIPVLLVPNDAKADTLLSGSEEKMKDIIPQKEGMNNALTPQTNEKWKLYAAIGLILIAFLVSARLFYNEKNCLAWKTDHYELVDCDENYPVVDYDEDLLKFRKLQVSDTTTFFKDGQPVVWYSKQNNMFEYFNADGKNPVTGKELKPITTYIIHSQILKK